MEITCPANPTPGTYGGFTAKYSLPPATPDLRIDEQDIRDGYADHGLAQHQHLGAAKSRRVSLARLPLSFHDQATNVGDEPRAY